MPGIYSIQDIENPANTYIDRTIDKYVEETSDPFSSWSSAVPKPKIEDAEKLRQVVHNYAANLEAAGTEVSVNLSDSAIQELVILCNSFQHEFNVLAETDATVNCAMYALNELGVESKLDRFSKAEEIENVLAAHFSKTGKVNEPHKFDFQNNDLLAWTIESNPKDRHYVIVEKDDKKTTFRSKLGSLFVVRNSDLTDLVNLYRAEDITVLRKKNPNVN